ncbi:hypothetical protein NST17_19700 [Caldifermentibacillus hisashii]|uniref:Uncharacterized protein n=1 Tax=Caldifermentibacillus hisashii TaxID=996558 RepID=A0ABU9K2S0_9BACI
MGYAKEEMETVLVFDYEEGSWTVYSTVPKHIRKLMEIGEVEIIEEENERPIAIGGTLTERQVSMKRERVMSEEQRQKSAEILKKTRLKSEMEFRCFFLYNSRKF